MTRGNNGIPVSVLSPDVHVGGMDVDAAYRSIIKELNDSTPTSDRARNLVCRTLLSCDTSVLWDRVVSEGEKEDTNHELRALICIARGDPRQLGEIYDELRRSPAEPVSSTDQDRARGMANRHGSHRERSPYFC